MKLQLQGIRKTLRLESADRAEAAQEAQALDARLRREGWAALLGTNVLGGRPVQAARLPIGPRKYVSELNGSSSPELFATLSTLEGLRHVALGTSDLNEARLRAEEVWREHELHGWRHVQLAHPWEVTVAVFWYSNPMACTYSTVLAVPARSGDRSSAQEQGFGPGWRVLILEPDGGVRRALASWVARAAGVCRADSLGSVGEVPAGGIWDLVLVNQEIRMTELRLLLERLSGRETVVLSHGVFPDSDAIFASVSGVSRGYLLKRLAPPELLAPIMQSFPDGPPPAEVSVDRAVRRYFQRIFEEGDTAASAATPELSGREQQILDRLSRGLSDKEVAGDLGISVWTVHSHLKRIFAKFGVRTRTEAVVRHLQK